MAKMGLHEEPQDPLFAKHQQLVKELNLDEETANQAWNSYQTIRTNYTLEGEDLHWLGCAIFVACKNSLTPTISKNVVKGNPISLTSLLRLCGISVALFFHKINSWMDMAKLNQGDEFRKRIKGLEDNFTITCNVYKEYFPIFERIFKAPDMQAVRHKTRKQRPPYCTPTKVFEFTWLIFITIKAKHKTNDLINAYYFLLSCFDLMFKNAYTSNMKELLNQNFDALPATWGVSSMPPNEEAPCIIEKLLMLRTDKLADAVYVKEYTVKKYIKDLIKEDVLRANTDTLTGLFDPGNFEHNYVNIVRTYDQLILTEGSIDERIFLAESQRQYILQNITATNGITNVHNDIDETTDDNASKNNSIGENNRALLQTPLTGRNYLKARDQNELPLPNESQSMARLQAILSGCRPEPSDNLSTIFQNCAVNPEQDITTILGNMNMKFVKGYTAYIESKNESKTNDGENKVELATRLFYKLLENMLASENINKISSLVAKAVFHESLYSCCLEIVLFASNTIIKLPWILDTLNIQAVNLVRIIELIVRSKDQFSRDTIKHLSYVEETILESLLWKSNSSIWEDIEKFEIPKFEEVALPTNMLQNNNGIQAVDARARLFTQVSVGQSPGPSAAETFQSPINTPVKKQLFPTVNIKPGQSLLQAKANLSGATPELTSDSLSTKYLMLTDQEGNKKLIPLEQQTIITSTPVSQHQLIQSPVSLPPPPPPVERPKKVGSHYIICRKFYNLAGVRLDHLCNKLGITELELQKKIWTVFEYSVKKNTDLLRDRHLDQLLMCAVYVICKVTGNTEKNFSEIMKCYRVQPQANSDIYRNVLINREQKENGRIIPETRSSLIDFYNTIYVQFIKNYVVQFSQNQENTDLLLSPLPSVKSLLVSPRQQIMRNVFVRPFESPNNAGNTQTNGTSYSYYFSRSASKELKDINKAINGNGITGKRLLAESFEIEIPNKKYANRKMQALIEERKVQNMD